MISLNQIYKYTPAKIKKVKIKTVKSVRKVKATYNTDEYGVHQEALFKVIATTIPRKVMVKLYGDPKLKSIFQRPVWVHCSCEWFTYFCEYPLAKRRSSKIINSNGQANREKNPRQWPYACKHVIAVMNKLSRVKFKLATVKAPSEEEIEFMLSEIDKYIPGAS